MARANCVISLLAAGYGVPTPIDATNDEQVLAQLIDSLLSRCGRSNNFMQKAIELLTAPDACEEFEFTEKLHCVTASDDHLPERSDEDWYEEVARNDADVDPVRGWTFHGVPFTSAEVDSALLFYHGVSKGARSLSSMQQKHYRMFKSAHDIRRLLLYEEARRAVGTAVASRRSHLAEVSRKTFSWFCEMYGSHIQLCNADIAAKARAVHAELGAPFRFDASSTWVKQFTSVHNIVSRRVTKWVSRKEVQAGRSPQLVASDFLQHIRPILADYDPEQVFNCDQSGCLLECHSARTMTVRGVKTVPCIANSAADISHSLTIMVPIAADGTLHKRLFVQVKQPNGRFPQNKAIFAAPNLVAVAGNSHIMTVASFKEFLTRVLIPCLPDRSLVLLDKWAGFGNAEAIALLAQAGKQVRVERIPEHTTSIIQPWDAYPARIWKALKKRIDSHMVLHEISTSLAVRDRELKTHSLIHNQLCAPRYRPLFRYAWVKTGYFDDARVQFDHPVECAFERLGVSCAESNCSRDIFMRCAHCEEQRCFHHFYECIHTHF